MMNNNKNNNPYGHLLDKYLDGTKHFDYRTEEQKKKEERARYGNLFDNLKPHSVWDSIDNVYKSCKEMERKKEEEYEQNILRHKERIEREKRMEEEHNAQVTAYAEYFLKRKWAEEEAKKKEEEKRRKEAEKKQEIIEGLRRLL